jgi:hypothetical protein
MADRTNRTIRTDKQIKNNMTIKKWIYKQAYIRSAFTDKDISFSQLIFRYCNIDE